MPNSDKKYILQSVSTALKILDLLNERGELSLTEICKELKIGKSSAFRVLYTLEMYHYVLKDGDARYCLSYKFAYYGENVQKRQSIVITAKPYLRQLTDKFEETAHLAILDGDYNVVYMAKEYGTSAIQMASQIGQRMAASCTSVGKMLLSGLPEEELMHALSIIPYKKYTDRSITSKEDMLADIRQIQKQGYSVDNEEQAEGLICYAAPVRSFNGKMIASISISGAAARMRSHKADLIQSLIDTAHAISVALGYEDEKKE